MAKPNRLREVEQQHGDLHKVIPALVNLHGQAEAGRLLGVSSATISMWLKANGYRQEVRYVREAKESA